MTVKIITENSIKELVDNFYMKIRLNKEIGYIFEQKIGTSQEDWQPHLQHMYDFWSSIMLSTGKYKRNPMQKHKDLPSFDESKFDIWLKLFANTANEIFIEEIANQFIEKSQNIARSLKYALYYKL